MLPFESLELQKSPKPSEPFFYGNMFWRPLPVTNAISQKLACIKWFVCDLAVPHLVLLFHSLKPLMNSGSWRSGHKGFRHVFLIRNSKLGDTSGEELLRPPPLVGIHGNHPLPVFSAAVGCNGCTQGERLSFLFQTSLRLKRLSRSNQTWTINLDVDRGSQIILSGRRQHRAINTQNSCAQYLSPVPAAGLGPVQTFVHRTQKLIIHHAPCNGKQRQEKTSAEQPGKI